MKNEEKIVELLAEMVKGQDKLVEEVTQMKVELIKQGLQTAENSRAILKLADEIRLVAEHEKRISKLELTVFK
jgi:CRISPR/Cas system-associated endonuclease Cas3-HD